MRRWNALLLRQFPQRKFQFLFLETLQVLLVGIVGFERQLCRDGLAVAQEAAFEHVADLVTADFGEEVVQVALLAATERVAVEPCDDVAGVDAGFFRRAARKDERHAGAVLFQTDDFGQFGADGLQQHGESGLADVFLRRRFDGLRPHGRQHPRDAALKLHRDQSGFLGVLG